MSDSIVFLTQIYLYFCNIQIQSYFHWSLSNTAKFVFFSPSIINDLSLGNVLCVSWFEAISIIKKRQKAIVEKG